MKKEVVAFMDLMKFFNYIEQKYPVNKWVLNNVDIWPLIRMHASFYFLNTARPSEKEEEIEKNMIGKLPTLSEFVEKEDEVDILILSDSFYRVELQGSWFHRVSDPFIEVFEKQGLKAVSLEFSEHNIERFPVWNKTYVINNQLNYIRNTLELDLRESGYIPFYEQVKEEFIGFGYDEKDFLSLSYLFAHTSYIHSVSQMFERILCDKKVKAVFMVTYYSANNFALISACHRLNIPSVDIQHGIHRKAMYHEWGNITDRGYNILPNYFWCWDKETKVEIDKWTSQTNAHKAITGGNLWIQLWKKNDSHLTKFYKEKLDKEIHTENFNILVTLQPLYGMRGWESNIPDFLLKKIDESPSSWKWHIRYHPQMLGNYRNEKKKIDHVLAQHIRTGKVETERATWEPLMALLKKMDIHITASSTSIVEAAQMNVPSIALHDYSLDFYDHERSLGLLEYADNEESLNEKIRSLKNSLGKLPLVKEEVINPLDEVKGILQECKTGNTKGGCGRDYDEILLADGRYKEIIEKYNNETVVDEGYYILGMAYKGISQPKKAVYYFDQYIDNLILNNSVHLTPVKKLITMSNFYNSINAKNISLINAIINLLNEDDKKKTYFFSKLFSKKEYKEVVYWCGKINKTLDVHFYCGRSHLFIGDLDKGMKELEKYVQEVSYNENKMNCITNASNFQLSALFYLGESYLDKKDFNNAIKYFEACSRISKGTHRKANMYLEELLK